MVVSLVRYRKGRFHNALSRRSSEENEANTIGLSDAPVPGGRVVVRQIAGAIARRIVFEPQQGGRVSAGQRIGMIKFGSRTELIVPDCDGIELLAHVGQRVRAGESVLCRCKGAEGGAEG